MLTFQDLPDELLLKILSFSERKDLIGCGQVALWLEMRNLNHLPFGMIMSLDRGSLHPSRLLRHEISQKKWKRPKKFLKATSKTR